MMQTKEPLRLWNYVSARISENFKSCWYTIALVASNWIIPVQLSLLMIQRNASYLAQGSKDADFDFSETIQKK